MTLKTDIDQIAVDAGLLNQIVQGSATTTVTTTGGPVKSVAKAVSDAEAVIISGASSYLGQCQDQVAAAAAQAQTATNQAAAAAGSALSAASVVSQDLSAIDRTVFAATTLVDVFLYDTSKDSDGGAWRKRCSHTSWENETLSGNWLGSAANEAAARAIAGAVTGSYYYDTTALGFYSLNAGSGVTQVYRGNARQFPAQVLITVESARVVLWDITQAGCPMWMICTRPGVIAAGDHNVWGCAASHGMVAVVSGHPTFPTYGGVKLLIFPADRIAAHNSSTADTDKPHGTFNGNISARNVAALAWTYGTTPTIISSPVNDVAMTVLPNAPVDVATGLPVPTIAVATNGGVSVIKDDGNVWDVSYSPAVNHSSIAFTYDNRIVVTQSDSAAVQFGNIPTADVANISTWRTGYYLSSNQPAVLGQTSASGKLFGAKTSGRLGHGNAGGLSVLVENPGTPTKGLVAYVTKNYTSGWLPGDIRGAWLADIVAETLTGAELVTNGTFATDATGWTALNGAGLGVASGELTVTNSGATAGGATQAITTVVGKTYVARMDARVGTATPVNLKIGTTSGGAELGSVSTTSGTNAPLMLTFVATGTTTYISCINDADSGGTGIYDNISCRLADVDRSVKAKGLQVFGSLTKAPVASGAQLMGYSGFSAANYLEQPYNSDLDFGTGNFCVMGWVIPTIGDQSLFYRGDGTSNVPGGINIWANGGSYLKSFIDNLSTYLEGLTVGAWNHVAYVRTSGVVAVYINGIKRATLANAGAVAGGTPVTWLGKGFYATGGQTMALWRASATAPSDEQIKHIYESEKKLFEANAQCCLAGTSNSVTALAYDDETDLLHVGTSYGRSAFKGLVRVASEATPVGAITALAAGAGIIAQAGATAVDVYVPAYLLREELLRDAEQMARFGQNLVAHDFTATASQTTFTLPVGWEIVAVYQQGALKRETTSWTRSFDGFKWSAVLGTGATVSDWISILAKRV